AVATGPAGRDDGERPAGRSWLRNGALRFKRDRTTREPARDADEAGPAGPNVEIDLQSPAGPDTPGRRRTPTAKAIGATMLMTALLGGAVIVAAVYGGAGRNAFGVGGGGTAADGVTVSAPLDGRDRATLDLISGAGPVRLKAVDLGGDLYRMTVGGGQPPRPTVQGDQVRMQLPGAGAVDIQVSTRVRWQVRVSGGASEQVLDLAGAPLSGFELLGGSQQVEASLPPAAGTFTVKVSGGVNQVKIRVPKGRPVKVRAGGGAGTVTLNGTRHQSVASGRVFIPPGFESTPDRYAVDMAVGVGSLTVEER
ncbi:hypothetical protein ACFQ0D_13095, partial [Micromonospora zhanjiangensis]